MSDESHPESTSRPVDGAGGKGLQITLGALIVLGLLSWYGYTNLQQGSSFQYFQNLDEFLATTPAMDGSDLRVHGYVANSSIDRDLAGKQVSFRVQSDAPHASGDAEETLQVVYPSLETPDLFKDGAEVVLEGQMTRVDGALVFQADNVLAKCPSKFEAKLASEQPGAEINL